MEGPVVVLDPTPFREAVAQHDFLSQAISEELSYVRAKHHVEHALGLGAFPEADSLILPEVIVGIKILIGAHNPVTPVAIPQGIWNRPLYARFRLDRLVALERDIVCSLAHMKDRVEKKLGRSCPGADNEIRLADRVAEPLAGAGAHFFYPEEEGNAYGDGEGCKKCGEPPVEQRLIGQLKEYHWLISLSETARSKRG